MSITLSQMLEQLYGVKTSSQVNKLVSAVGLTASKILSNNPNRVSFAIVNLSGNSLWIHTGEDVSSTNGFFIASNGGHMIMQWDRDFELCSQEWWGIAGGAGSSVYILENISI